MSDSMGSGRMVRIGEGAAAPIALAVLAPLWAGCAATGASSERAADGDVVQDEEEPEAFEPTPATAPGDDWIKLESGEWLRGELSSMSKDRIEFDSEELDDLEFDWDTVVELVTEEPFTLLLTDRSTLVGVPHVDGKEIVLRTADGERRLRRKDVMGFVRGRPRERNYWSGEVRFGGTIRSGNTDQLDTNLAVAATRRTAASRLSLSLDSVYGEVEDVESVNNQTLTGSFDYYITRRFYARPLGFELFHDSIQNIDLRATPYAAVGYLLVDDADLEWEVNGGLGYRYTRFDSVAQGEDDTQDAVTALLGTLYTDELTPNVDLTFGYGIQMSLEDSDDTTQKASFGLTFDFLWALDFNFNAVWHHVGMPETDADGETPEEDDLRLDIGVSWEF